jgi:GT2 family glycosyltransferase
VSFNSFEYLKECLASISRQEGVTFETIVIDNGSRDSTVEFLNTQNCDSIISPQNLGFGAAVNRAAETATGKYLLILNPDTVLPKDCLSQFCDCADHLGEFGLLSPAFVHPDGRIQPSARNYPSRIRFLISRGSPLFKLGISGEKDAGYLIPEGNDPILVPAVSATALFMKRSLFQGIGGFDSRYFMYLEDLDLCRRVEELKLTIWLLPSIKVIHNWGQSSKTRPYFALFHHHLSVLEYFRKYYPSQWFYNSLLAIALGCGMFISSALIMFGGRRQN